MSLKSLHASARALHPTPLLGSLVCGTLALAVSCTGLAFGLSWKLPMAAEPQYTPGIN